jgi:perosamine synthetase
MTNLCAAIGVAQLEQADIFIKRKRDIALLYKELLSIGDLIFQSEEKNAIHSYWMISILVSDAEERDKMRTHLASHGIETRPLFYPVHTMPMYTKRGERHPVAENISARGLNLPSWPGLTDKQVRFVCEKILNFYG